MSFLKCKMCGGELEILDGSTVAECLYCSTKQTVPRAIDENMQNLFNRANTLRMKGEFDKAEKNYERIIQLDSKQAEAYWGLILSKYGIEYVDDPKTHKKIPTCHRASYDSIIADEDYKSAIQYADLSQKWIYEEQAKEIDRIQKEILALAQKEETYDIFICYKETDENGQRTLDSTIANEIYYQLTNEGYKVFYAAITLEGKLGEEYEPIIFAALNSAKVMLAIGTHPEYFNSVWVKNEWSRFLRIIQKDRSRSLFPCYRDMDAYELPEEFAHLQAQDMSKIGFINDLVRGIKKVVQKDVSNVTTQKNVFSANISPLLKRVFMFLEDEDWKSAEEYCEKVLDQDPENAQAYLGKLMAELRVKKQDDLKNCSEPFDNNLNYRKVMRFGDDALKSTLSGYIEFINNRRFNPTYLRAVETMKNASSIDSYEIAMKTFERISGWKDSDKLAQECKKIIEELKIKAETDRKDKILNDAKKNMKFATVLNYNTAFEMLQKIRDWKNANELIKECEKGIEQLKIKAENDRKDEILNLAKEEMKSSTVLNYDMAIELLKKIRSWKNANELIKECEKGIEQLKIKAENDHKDKILNDAKEKMCYSSIENYREAIDILKNIHGWKNADELIIECENSIERIHIEAENERKDKILNDAKSKMNSPTIENFQEAVVRLKQISGWKNANELIKKCEKGIEQLKIKAENDRKDKILNDAKENVNFASITSLEELIEKLQSIADWKDASEQIEICKLKLAECIKKEKALERKRKAKKAIPFIIAVVLVIALIVLAVIFVPIIRVNVYMSNGEYGKIVKMKELTEFTIPDGVREIDSGEFKGCKTLETVIIPDSVLVIGKDAFLDCTNLKNVKISNNVTEIGSTSFYNCPIEKATVPVNVTAYLPRESLKELVVTSGDGRWSSYPLRGASGCSNLTSVTILDGVTNIGHSAFSGCTGLTSVTIPDSVTSIGYYAFSGCTGLTSVTIPDSVTSIGEAAFDGCTGLTSMTIPNSVTSIGDSAFDACTGLTSITIPNSVTSIGDYAFSGCTGLTSITIPDSVTSIGKGAVSSCTKLENIIVGENNISYKSIDGNLYSKDEKMLLQYAPGKIVTSFAIPDSVTSIVGSAFAGCTALENITIPSGVKEIGAGAFSGCSNLKSAEFEVSSWKVYSTNSNYKKIDVSKSDPAGAAKYLTDTYCSKPWKRAY